MAGITVTPITEKKIAAALRDIPLGGLRYFETIGSTNDVALAWATNGAPDLSLIIANEQVSGRGRGKHSWYSPAGAALVFSLVLRPKRNEINSVPLFSGLGAMAACCALDEMDRLVPEIKWPNDVLLSGRKVSGILAEAVWVGNKVESVVLGIGVNVARSAVPPTEGLNFPATSLEAEMNSLPDRVILLRKILAHLLVWRHKIGENSFVKAWEERLAYKGQPVQIHPEVGEEFTGLLDGLENDGGLRLCKVDGQIVTVHFGEVHLRPGI